MNNRKRQKTGYPKFREREIWNLGFVLAKHIAKGLKQFKCSYRMGHPGDITEEEWELMLDKMIWSFDQVANDYPSSPINLKFDEYFREHPDDIGTTYKNEEGYTIYKPMDIDLTPEDYEVNEKYHNRVKDGLVLFAERISDLWD